MQRQCFRPRLLLTGFGPFPGMPVNASGVLVAELARRLVQADVPVELATAILPTEWKAGPAALQRVIKAFRPDVALHFGVASEVTGFRLEMLAENARVRLTDASGYMPRAHRISAVWPAQLLSTFPADTIRQRLEMMGLRVELSSDAGRYLCNAALFRSLSLAARGKGARLAGFVHIPAALAEAMVAPAPAGSPAPACSLQDFDWSRAITGSLAIVEICLAHAAASLELCSGRGLGPATGSTGATV